jgi:Fe-S cluster assembly ATPase SufC
LRAVARRVEALTEEIRLGVLAITDYSRLPYEVHADQIHVFSKGRIVASGSPELAKQFEDTGSAVYAEEEDGTASAQPADPFGDPLARGAREAPGCCCLGD